MSNPERPSAADATPVPRDSALSSGEECGGARENKPTPRSQTSTVGSVVIPQIPSQPRTDLPSIPGYEIIDVIGRGGMGLVYKACHQRLNRIVALKVISTSGLSPDSDAVKRFQREAQTAAQLFHPNVVIVFDSDQVEDTYFIAMEYVEGTDLHHLVKDSGPLDIDLACDFIQQAAMGLQHAFERGLVHRDIKPSNLLVAVPGGGAPAKGCGGVVKLLDMGLALAAHLPNSESAQWTQTGALMGTPDFIAPEQALDSHAVDVRSDLYSLGCTFYYLLAGKAPFGEFPLMRKLMLHQTGEPRPVEEVRPEVTPALAAVVRKLMAKRPDQRYQTPAELIQALVALNAPKAVPKSPPGPATPPPVIPTRQPSVTPSERSSDSTVKVVQPSTATQVVDLPPGVSAAEKIAVLDGHRGWVTSLVFAPNRATLISGGVDGGLRFWALSSSKGHDRAVPRAHDADITALAATADSRFLASGTGSLAGNVSFWDYSREEPGQIATVPTRDTTVDALAFAPNGQLVAVGGSDKLVRVWDLSAGPPTSWLVLKGHGNLIKTLAFASDSKLLASGSQDGTLRLWDLGRFWSKELVVLDGGWGPVRTVAFSPDRKMLAFGCLDQSVRLWALSGPETGQRAVLTGHIGVARLVHFNPDGKTLVSVCDGGRIILWNLATGAKEREWMLPRAKVYNSVALTFDGRYLAAGDSEGRVWLFRLYPRQDG